MFRTIFRILATAVMFWLAYRSLGSPIGVFFCTVVVVIWFLLIGHHWLEAFIHRIFRFGRSEYTPESRFAPKVQRLIEKRKLDDAVKVCREWIRYEHENSEPILRIVEIYVDHQKKIPEAIRELELSVSRPFPVKDHIALAKCLAQLYRENGRAAEVEAIFRRVRSLHSASPEIAELE